MKLVIIGGVAGGASAAARARRLNEQAEIIVFERGEHISFANCGLPYYVGQVIEKRESLLIMTPGQFKARTRIDVRIRQEVTAIDPVAHKVAVRDLSTGEAYEEAYDKLILATGSSPIRPAIPGADDRDVMGLWTMADMDRVRERVDAGIRKATVIGGGFLGLEVVENLRQRGIETTLVERLPQLLASFDPEMTSPLRAALERHGVTLYLNTAVKAISRQRDGNGTDVAELTIELEDGTRLTSGLVVMAIGVRPNAELARKAGLSIGPRGGVVVNAFLQSSDPDIYAVGDVAQVVDRVLQLPTQLPLAGPANRQGRLAADNVFGARREYLGTLGTSAVKVFNLTAANAGANEKSLRTAGIPFHKIYLNPFSHATYYPGAKMMHLKLLFAGNGRILGVQIVGEDGVDKRIDVLATAMQAGLTVFDLESLELAYAPPYGAAKDPVNFAGFVAANLLRGETDAVSPDAVPEGALLLDVREASEVQAGSIPGALAIPLGKLRDRLAELPKNRRIIAFCAVGLRGYLAERILKQNGYQAANLSGGFVTWRLFQC